jgi:hypothetical protein
VDNISFDVLGLLFGVIEIRMVPNILVYAFKSPWCNVTSSRTM